MSAPDPILSEVETFIEANRLTPTGFGKLAAQDPRLVFQLRDGRELRRSLRERVRAFMRDYKPEAERDGEAA